MTRLLFSLSDSSIGNLAIYFAIIFCPIIIGCFFAKRYNTIHGFLMTFLVGLLIPSGFYTCIYVFDPDLNNFEYIKPAVSLLQSIFYDVLEVGLTHLKVLDKGLPFNLSAAKVLDIVSNPYYMLAFILVLWIFLQMFASYFRRKRVNKVRRIERQAKRLY